jgi:GR25 family glycosyltransferase involved in LPS biosynthesis
MLKTYVISLQEPTHLLQTLPLSGLSPVWIQGVNGASLTPAERRTAATPFFAAVGTDAAIGIGMSHLKALQAVIDNRDEHALIVEDDVVLEPQFREQLIPVMAHVPADFDILYLGCFGCTSQRNIIQLTWSMLGFVPKELSYEHVNQWIARPSAILGAHAYIVSRTGARKLLHLLTGTIHNHIDVCYQTLMAHGDITVYVSKPLLAVQTSTNPGVSNTSKNVAGSHPILLQNAASHITVEKGYNLKYTLGFVLIDRPLKITIMTMLFLLVGIALQYYGVHWYYITGAFALLSLPDIWYWSDTHGLVLNYMALFIIPVLLKHSLHLIR